MIICSISPARLERVSASIAQTIGLAHEIVVIDNRERGLGLCAAYNEGAQRAIYPILCFVHEDVEFLTGDWGVRVLEHFDDDARLGLIGVAGGRYKAAVPSGWSTGMRQDICMNVYHGADKGSMWRMYYRPEDAERIEVVAIDGVWMCTRRSVWHETPFDERVDGFHFYDVDFSLRVAINHTVSVIFDIDLLHYSMGNFGADWATKALSYYSSAPVELPFYIGSLTAAEIRQREVAATRYWLRILRKAHFSPHLRWRWILASRAWRSPALWRPALRYLLDSGK
ncbi:glycosyltransferase [Phytopseudomonas daroniae]|uniref:glycosyltransferase n=1 Tax=Pseudomonadaceae TaxID=135621 RepID=UPI001F6041EB|nr:MULTISPECIES: glycosyltransferase [Pseudomonas]